MYDESNVTTCDYPRPAPFPTPREDVSKHCYKGRKCFWYEAGICYADEPSNHRYPHAAGRSRVRDFLQDSIPEERIDSEIIRKCNEEGWRRNPWYKVIQGCCHPCFARCNDVEPMAECSTDTVTIWKFGAESYEVEYEVYDDQ